MIKTIQYGGVTPPRAHLEYGIPVQYDDPVEIWPSSSLDPSGSVFDLGLFDSNGLAISPAGLSSTLDLDMMDNRSETDEMPVDEPRKDVHQERLSPLTSPSHLASDSLPPQGFSLLSFSSAPPSSTSSSSSSHEAVSDVTATPSRKRRRLEDTLQDLTLPPAKKATDLHALQDSLVSLSSDHFQEYVRAIERSRPLSRSEQQLVRTLKRRILNRESARRSRQDRKDQVGLMEDRIDQLTKELQETKLEAAQLLAQNHAIRNEIAFSQSLIHSNPVLQQLYDDVRQRHLTLKRSEPSPNPSSSPSPTGPSTGHTGPQVPFNPQARPVHTATATPTPSNIHAHASASHDPRDSISSRTRAALPS